MWEEEKVKHRSECQRQIQKYIEKYDTQMEHIPNADQTGLHYNKVTNKNYPKIKVREKYGYKQTGGSKKMK